VKTAFRLAIYATCVKENKMKTSADDKKVKRNDAVDNIGLIGAEPLDMTSDNVLAFIERRQHVTFVELHRYFTGFEGELCYGDLLNNILYWSGMSEEVCDILDELVSKGKIYAKPTVFLTYLADGGGLDAPLAKRQNFHYKKPRWLPVTWCSKSHLRHESPAIRKQYDEQMLDRRNKKLVDGKID